MVRPLEMRCGAQCPAPTGERGAPSAHSCPSRPRRRVRWACWRSWPRWLSTTPTGCHRGCHRVRCRGPWGPAATWTAGRSC